MAHLTLLTASDGKNMVLAEKFAAQASSMGHTTDIVDLMALEWPVYCNKLAKGGFRPEDVKDVMARMDEGVGWVCIAPEYNGSLPSALNNTIAWISKQGDDFRALFNNRKVGLATHSGGGGDYVIMAMRQQFGYLGCNVIGRSVTSNFSKEANPETIESILNQLCA
ncbi:MAG: NADPH-dependent FMN reductase [Candidatus Poseidoniales archaeon]|jgi:NAD(P)H-dependent FMN reductase|tara:strand:+ start:188 stop:685 length:498 start_codon:yes stop_codon:yes gene_type:complete